MRTTAGRALLALLSLCWAATLCVAARGLPEADGGSGRDLLQRTIDCKRIHRACSTCRNQRIAGTKRTETICSNCMGGWKLRKDGQFKTCDCVAGMALNGTGDSNSWCTSCTAGQYCVGGGPGNPTAAPADCAAGLTTFFNGAKSEAQCFTEPGYSRKVVKRANGRISYTASQCGIGKYNDGKNTLEDCKRCPPGLTTLAKGATSLLDCYAPPGWYRYREGANDFGKPCAKGSFTTDYNQNNTCNLCTFGTTTLGEGYTSINDCAYADIGYFMSGPHTATECPVNTYNAVPTANITECTLCPNGWLTEMPGATGIAMCMAPPGYELKANATNITKCELNYFKINWNRNPCIPCGPNLITEGDGSISFEACMVPAGFGIKSTMPPIAVMCVNNTYGSSEIRGVSLEARCAPCGPNLGTLDALTGVPATQGYTDDIDCVLRPGYGMSQSGTGGEICEVGWFNPGLNREGCTSCETKLTTLYEGALTAAECVIEPGWAFDPVTGLNKPCDRGTYSTGGNLTDPEGSCVTCPVGYTTQEASSKSLAECDACKAGYASPPGTTTCDVCPYNKWSSGDSAIGLPCYPCQPGTVSKRRSTNLDECMPEFEDAWLSSYSLSSDRLWTAVPGVTTQAACKAACSADTNGCIVARFSDGGGGEPQACQIYSAPAGLSAGANGTQQVAVKADGGADWALYTVPANVTIGVLHEDSGDKTLAGCMAACKSVGRCELFTFPSLDSAATGPCKLWKSELDPDYNAQLHVLGPNLWQDMLLVQAGVV